MPSRFPRSERPVSATEGARAGGAVSEVGGGGTHTPAAFSSSSFAHMRDCFPRLIAISRLREMIILLFANRELCSLALRARSQNVLDTSQEAGIKFGKTTLK